MLLDGEGLLNQILLFAKMHGLGPSRGTGGPIASGIADMMGIDAVLKTRPDVGPRPHIERLFLAPDKFGGVFKRSNRLLEKLFMERVELLDANDRGVLNLLFLAMLNEVVVDLATTKDHPLDILELFGSKEGIRKHFAK